MCLPVVTEFLLCDRNTVKVKLLLTVEVISLELSDVILLHSVFVREMKNAKEMLVELFLNYFFLFPLKDFKQLFSPVSAPGYIFSC